MLVELYSYIILSPEPLEVSGKKILPYYRFHTHSFWWCQTLILINTEKWNWHIRLLFASYRRIQSTNCSFLSVLSAVSYIFTYSQDLSWFCLLLYLNPLTDIYWKFSVLSGCMEQKVLGGWIRSDQSNLSLIKMFLSSAKSQVCLAFLN